MLDESKFFGYLNSDLCTLLMDISEFGLQATPGSGVQAGPRFYMKYLEAVWFVLFVPGSRDCVVGDSGNVIRRSSAELEEEERLNAEKMAIAQKFDAKLEQEVSLGRATMVDVTKKTGWMGLMGGINTSHRSGNCAVYRGNYETPQRAPSTRSRHESSDERPPPRIVVQKFTRRGHMNRCGSWNEARRKQLGKKAKRLLSKKTVYVKPLVLV